MLCLQSVLLAMLATFAAPFGMPQMSTPGDGAACDCGGTEPTSLETDAQTLLKTICDESLGLYYYAKVVTGNEFGESKKYEYDCTAG